ncbi:hypothetical protein JTE90_013648 [Oedothorax gibbosus]|uniref:Uncharacterized protein n=1 Tax=Oedothorax gibbosus TaxID=931172 RepID=A0AAV6TUE2_9ARAC|nr:hypothetical protein JTE90_013648 [Oedothorax gibbosus]
MEKDKDNEYSEIIELFSIQPPDPTVPTRNPTAEAESAETKFGLYINLADIVRPRDTVSDVGSTTEERTSTTFKRYSSIEETDVVHYENAAQLREGMDRMASTEQILSVDERNEDAMSLRTRLKYKKQRLGFVEFSAYAMMMIYEEVEKVVCLDVVFFLFSAVVTCLGCNRLVNSQIIKQDLQHDRGCGNLGSCRVSPRIPVMMVVSGLMDGVADIFSVWASFAKRLDWQDILRDSARVARVVMFFLHFYGLLIVYKSLPPEEENPESSSYCDPATFWLAFSYFHITFLSSVFIWIGMLVAIACHFR